MIGACAIGRLMRLYESSCPLDYERKVNKMSFYLAILINHITFALKTRRNELLETLLFKQLWEFGLARL